MANKMQTAVSNLREIYFMVNVTFRNVKKLTLSQESKLSSIQNVFIIKCICKRVDYQPSKDGHETRLFMQPSCVLINLN